MRPLTIADIERVDGTSKTWRATRPMMVGAIYCGVRIIVRVRRHWDFQFSWPWGLRWLADPNALHNAVFAFWHDVALHVLKSPTGGPLDRRWAARWAEERARESIGRRRWWLLRRNRIAARIWTHDLAAARRLFHAWSNPDRAT